ncbi:PREDICTED: peptide deformylase, mitochondrial-like [Polistes dominula]|uniref:Peptide deformylase n=1 Tax=Polistes dominula TaxID=743375 RepID=A0ABM1IEU5_POLDO|nr:PREDICTED: peptide deformylase, mitochondrial-like [Polistes dominula]XP_015178728.1 PREDICTED: peptide deformylase, mitochondrial-like [Polistes dominula]XP_015178729.1 PREDICTED: peptide deformylase, mitochondrial-like [Polistes dominula]XP_015178731.1 PREDICTED: peptide deformylase, mitochondrial-like [Polistes dominula]XP_015178732.1 PREDICTED: peptide deformylase, mitochondrial-like [Polistes dominula]
MFNIVVPAKRIGTIFPSWKNNMRSFGYLRRIRRAFRKYVYQTESKPPYFHVTQIGDPVLRAPTLPVNPEVIDKFQFKLALEQMKRVMKLYNTVGLSACQIGLPWKVFMIHVNEQYLKEVGEEISKIREMEIVPLQVFINPKIRIIDHKLITFPELCASVRGYTAEVPRAREVEITALNELKEQFTVRFKGWTARIVQHEMDHLNGIIYTDKMNKATFSCCYWDDINRHKGLIEIRFDS